jgi:tetratricopeptide (TPR) repeat protein
LAAKYLYRGNAQFGSRKYDDASASYQVAIDIDPGNVAAHNNLGNLYAKQGKYDLAIGSYKRAICIAPGIPVSHNNLGLVFAEQGKKQPPSLPMHSSASSSYSNILFSRGAVS